MRAHKILIAVIVALVLVYTLGGFLLIPRIVTAQLQNFATQELNKKASVGEVRFNPFTLDASIAGLLIAELDDRPLLEFRHLYLNAEIASLWRRAIVLKEIELSAPAVHVVVAKDGTLNLAGLVPPGPDSAEESTAPFPVHIDHLSVREGRIDVEDNTLSKPFFAVLAPIHFALTDFKTDAGHRNDYRFSGTTLAGEDLEWSGGFTVKPLGSAGRFKIHGLKSATIDSYLYESLPFRLASGHAQLDGTYQFSLEPLTFDVTLPLIAIRELSVAERSEGAAPPVRVPELDVEGVTFSYDKRTLGAKRIGVRGAQLDVAREGDGSISLMRLLGDSSKQPQVSKISTTPAPSDDSSTNQASWSATVDVIRLDEAALAIEDRAISPAVRFALSPINLTIEGWSTEPSAKLKIAADVAINDQASFTANGAVQLEPLTTSLAIELADFDLAPLQPYVSRAAALTLHTGKAAAKGTLDFASPSHGAPTLRFVGDARVTNLRTTDRFVTADFVKWRDLAVTGIDYRQNPARVSIDRIVARAPYASVIIAPDTTLNVAKVMTPPTAGSAVVSDEHATKTAPPTAPAQLPISIRTVQIIDGSAQFADQSIQPSFATGIVELDGKITGLSSAPATRAQVMLTGKVDRYAPVDIEGEVNLLAAAKYTALGMNFRNMELTTFNPYSGKFAGYAISKGKLTTELKYRVEDRKLLAEHHIVVDNLEFGDKTESKDAAPIPMKLAVALLKDRNGVINLDLPVSGTLDDPQFRLGPIIWKAVVGLLTKIVTAPFAALGALIGGGEELAFVNFVPGSAELDPAEAEKLGKLSKALTERPQLRLDVPLTLASEQDSNALAHSALAGLVPPQDVEGADEATLRRRLAQLESVYKTQVRQAPQYPPETKTKDGIDYAVRIRWIETELLKSVQPDQAQLDELARARAQAVQGALLTNTELDPQRVFITTDRKADVTSADKIRMEMKLE